MFFFFKFYFLFFIHNKTVQKKIQICTVVESIEKKQEKKNTFIYTKYSEKPLNAMNKKKEKGNKTREITLLLYIKVTVDFNKTLSDDVTKFHTKISHEFIDPVICWFIFCC